MQLQFVDVSRSDMSVDKAETAADRAIREALASVERIEQEAKGGDGVEADVVIDDGAGQAAGEAPDVPKKTAAEATMEALIKGKHELEEVLAQTQKEAKDMFERLARVSADFENYKKRQQRERDEAVKFGNEKLLKEMLPVLDNLHRALSSATADDPVLSGVRLVAKQFDDALGRFGVVGFDSMGLPFDPARHEAVGSRASDVIAQHVCEEYQRGYLLQDRLLRPALVIVSSGPASDVSGSGA
jgi:molecular chaperone GrpE